MQVPLPLSFPSLGLACLQYDHQDTFLVLLLMVFLQHLDMLTNVSTMRAMKTVLDRKAMNWSSGAHHVLRQAWHQAEILNSLLKCIFPKRGHQMCVFVLQMDHSFPCWNGFLTHLTNQNVELCIDKEMVVIEKWMRNNRQI